MTVAWKFLKNKSTVHGEIFEVRAYMLQCNTASSQATAVSKTNESASAESKVCDGIVVGVGSNFCSLLLEPTPTLKISQFEATMNPKKPSVFAIFIVSFRVSSFQKRFSPTTQGSKKRHQKTAERPLINKTWQTIDPPHKKPPEIVFGAMACVLKVNFW